MVRVAGFEKESVTDGTGVRYTIFMQGCKHNCPGCHNTSTHSFEGGTLVSIDEIMKDIIIRDKEDILDGVTLSGGDPIHQVDKCIELTSRIKNETKLNIWVYTGFTYEELLEDKQVSKLLRNIDVLVDGRYEQDKRCLELKFRGSYNQRVIDVQKSLACGKTILIETGDIIENSMRNK